jgi:hypothetical protein
MNAPVGIPLRPIAEISPIALMCWGVRFKAKSHKTSPAEAQDWLVSVRAPAAVRERIIKAPVGAIGTGDVALAPAYGISVGDWSQSAATKSAFYAILNAGGFWQQKMYSRVEIVNTPIAAGEVLEGKAIPASHTTLSNIILTPRKAARIVYFTDAVLFAVDASGQRLFSAELLRAVALAVDNVMISRLTTGLSAITSTSALADVRAALQAVITIGESPELFWVASSDVGAFAATLSISKTSLTMAEASAVGGRLAGIPFLISSAAPAGTLLLVNGNKVAAAAETPSIDVTSEASLEPSDAPVMDASVPTAANTVNLFQENATALRCIAPVAIERLRNNAVGWVSGITSSTWSP